MLSFVQRDVDGHWSWLSVKQLKSNYRGDFPHGQVRADFPVVLMTKQFRVVCGLGARGTFRMLFTFHNVLELEYLCF